ncbi:unnamed protein product [Schistocephalus solidus]|uniref:Leucine rich repeat variant n=1 Tax=Schistocephalus solidus TaxID=70667 RepID=A0A183SUC7_SCHSO|nr:unnamed protein product [Schistocephalus solidus]
MALNTGVLERLVAGFRDPQIRRALLRDRPSTLEKAHTLAREEEVIETACELPPRSLFGVATVQSHSSHDAATQTPWQPCSCGSSPRRNNWRRHQTRQPNKPHARRSLMPSTQPLDPVTVSITSFLIQLYHVKALLIAP